MRMDARTRRELGRIIQQSPSVETLSGAIRGMTSRFLRLLELQCDAEEGGRSLYLVAAKRPPKGEVVERLNCRL